MSPSRAPLLVLAVFAYLVFVPSVRAEEFVVDNCKVVKVEDRPDGERTAVAGAAAAVRSGW